MIDPACVCESTPWEAAVDMALPVRQIHYYVPSRKRREPSSFADAQAGELGRRVAAGGRHCGRSPRRGTENSGFGPWSA